MNAALLHTIIPRHRGIEAFGSLGMALLMHGLLAALLFFGIHWQSQPPSVIQAELWSALPQIAAPAPPPAPAVEKPVPEIQRNSEPPPLKADIAIKEDKPKKPLPVQKPKLEPKPEPKPVPAPIKPAPTKPVVVEKPPTNPSQSLKDLIASAGVPASTGNAVQTSGPRGDPNYAGLIQAKILSNLRFPLPPDLVGNPEARFVIEQLPSGEIVTVKKTKASGLPAFDAAVERAIQASSPLPKRKDGSYEKSLELVFKPVENN